MIISYPTTSYFLQVTGNGNVGVGVSAPMSTADVAGNMSVGSYAGVTAAPTNGMIISGNVGIGTSAPISAVSVYGNVGIGTFTADNGKLIVRGGNVGIGTINPISTMEVNGTFSVRGASTSPFTVKASTNQACNTTCGTSMAIFGEDTIGLIMLAPSDATADTCLCAGP